MKKITTMILFAMFIFANTAAASNTCWLTSGFACLDLKQIGTLGTEDAGFQIVIQNSAGMDITNISVELVDNLNNYRCKADNAGISLTNGMKNTFNAICGSQFKGSFNGTISISYIVGTNYANIPVGTFATKTGQLIFNYVPLQPVYSCTDSDNGQVTGTLGTIKYVDSSGNTISKTDTCADSTHVTEYYCNGNEPAVSSIACPSGTVCSKSVCVVAPLPIHSCTDSDNGLNYYVAGKVTICSQNSSNDCSGHTEYQDTCVASNGFSFVSSGPKVSEVYCRGSDVTWSRYLCPNGCNNGACIQESTRNTTPKATTCVDSDGGKNYYVKGTTSGYFVGYDVPGIKTMSDSCIYQDDPNSYHDVTSCDSGDECFVRENFPTDDRICTYEIGKCSAGCNIGACLKEGEQVVAETNNNVQPQQTTPTDTTNIQQENQVAEPTQQTALQPIATEPRAPKEPSCNGCKSDDVCLPFGNRKGGKFCDTDKTFKDEKESGACDNSYECTSNLCINNECVEPSLWKRILAWFGFFD